MIDRPHAPATLRNREPIFSVLKNYFANNPLRILEVGSGTGEHGVFFAKMFTNIQWVFTDLADQHEGIQQWIDGEGVSNVEGPYDFDFGKDTFHFGAIDLIFTANTFHIMPWETVEKGIDKVGSYLKKGQRFMIYGPFNYDGKFSSPSNAHFHEKIQSEDSSRGIRNFEDVDFAMQSSGMALVEDHIMPANNQLLVFEKGLVQETVDPEAP